MKFGRSIPLLLFFGLLLPTFINAKPKECSVGGKCYWYGQTTSEMIPSLLKKKTCGDGICYAFKCMHSDGKIMYGSGCHEDFVSTCGYIQSSIMESAKGNKTFRHSDENVIVVSCGEVTDPPVCASYKFVGYVNMNKNVEAVFGLRHNKTENQMNGCDYDSKGLPPFKPQVQCTKGGQCLTGLSEILPVIYPIVTCDACAGFICNVNGKLMVGSGCLNDFERICTNIPAAEMQKIKAGKNYYNYIDENNVVSSCAIGDNCQNVLGEAFYATVKEKTNKIIQSIPATGGEDCPYDPLQPPKPSESNGYKLSGMFALGLILFYIW